MYCSDYSFDSQGEFLVHLVSAKHDSYPLVACVTPVVQEPVTYGRILKHYIVNMAIPLELYKQSKIHTSGYMLQVVLAKTGFQFIIRNATVI